MERYHIIAPTGRGSFESRLDELRATLRDLLEREKPRTLQYAKVFLSDAQNQQETLLRSPLYTETLSRCHNTIVEQPPCDGSKITLLVNTSDAAVLPLFHSLRLTEEEAAGNDSYVQTMLLFKRYLADIEKRGLSMGEHLVRTWIYVADIDVNYSGMVRARNELFARHGLTAATHFVASTGIGGHTNVRNASVAIDCLTYPDIEEKDKRYLKALSHLNPTHEYGVAFERGTLLTVGSEQIAYISGTASINNKGKVMFEGNVLKQAGRLLENIGALLKDAQMTMDDTDHFVVYLRDMADYAAVGNMMSRLYPSKPTVIVHAKVCRPQWLIEMECVARRHA